MSNKKFKNVDLKGFNFRNYLESKYDGLFDKSTPSKKEINEMKNKIRHSKNYEDAQRLTVQRNKMVSKFNEVWAEWRKQQ